MIVVILSTIHRVYSNDKGRVITFSLYILVLRIGDSMADILPAMVMERLSIALTRANGIY